MRGWWRIQQELRRGRDRMALVRGRRRVARFPHRRVAARHGFRSPLAVSLTSYPPRFATLANTLKTLLSQSVAADRVILWIAEADRSQLPAEVCALAEYDLEIRTCPDLRSYKKLLPALELLPEHAIVTADDDICYNEDWLAGLVEEARSSEGDVIAHRAHLARRTREGTFWPYSEWEMATDARTDRPPEGMIFPTGMGGVLYPPGSLDRRVADAELALRLCPDADDVWFFWMTRLAGWGHRATRNPPLLVPWDGSQQVALYHDNWLGGRNDLRIAAMQHAFGVLPDAARGSAAEEVPEPCAAGR